MTNLELLTLAAKAADIRFVGYDEYYQDFCAYDSETDVNYQWNPIASDGDAFRLAMKLGITIDRNDCSCCVVVWHNDIDTDEMDDAIFERFVKLDFEHPENRIVNDVMTAARKAIVRMAAELGKLKGN